jgi:hypothetical protein
MSSAPVDADLVGTFRAVDFDVALSPGFIVWQIANLGENSGNPRSTEFITFADLENTTAAPARQRLADPVFLLPGPSVTMLNDLGHCEASFLSGADCTPPMICL